MCHLSISHLSLSLTYQNKENGCGIWELILEKKGKSFGLIKWRMDLPWIDLWKTIGWWIWERKSGLCCLRTYERDCSWRKQGRGHAYLTAFKCGWKLKPAQWMTWASRLMQRKSGQVWGLSPHVTSCHLTLVREVKQKRLRKSGQFGKTRMEWVALDREVFLCQMPVRGKIFLEKGPEVWWQRIQLDMGDWFSCRDNSQRLGCFQKEILGNNIDSGITLIFDESKDFRFHIVFVSVHWLFSGVSLWHLYVRMEDFDTISCSTFVFPLHWFHFTLCHSVFLSFFWV
jgi:hypothetical protein